MANRSPPQFAGQAWLRRLLRPVRPDVDLSPGFVAANWAPASLHFLVGYRQGEYRHDLPVLDYMLDPSYKADDGDATA
jgi:hypothetical protein